MSQEFIEAATQVVMASIAVGYTSAMFVTLFFVASAL
jgi:hypothetical protein